MLSFDEAVERIKELDAQEGMTAFEMGDVALEQAALGDDGKHNKSTPVLERLAAETGVAYATLRNRRLIASRVPPILRRIGVPWSVYQIVGNLGDVTKRALFLTSVQDEAPPGKHQRWSVNAVREWLELPPTNGTAELAILIEHAEPEEKVEAFDVLTKDEHIVEQASDYTTPTAEALGKLEVASARLAQQRNDEHWVQDPLFQAHDGRVALFALATALRVFAESIDTLLPRLRQLPPGAEDRWGHDLFLTAGLERAQEAMLRVTQFIETGRTDLDAFLGEVLQGDRRD